MQLVINVTDDQMKALLEVSDDVTAHIQNLIQKDLTASYAKSPEILQVVHAVVREIFSRQGAVDLSLSDIDYSKYGVAIRNKEITRWSDICSADRHAIVEEVSSVLTEMFCTKILMNKSHISLRIQITQHFRSINGGYALDYYAAYRMFKFIIKPGPFSSGSLFNVKTLFNGIQPLGFLHVYDWDSMPAKTCDSIASLLKRMLETYSDHKNFALEGV